MAVIIIHGRPDNAAPTADNVFWHTAQGKQSHRLAPGETIVLPEYAANSGLYTKVEGNTYLTVEYAGEPPQKK